jgi:hypothetical protein
MRRIALGPSRRLLIGGALALAAAPAVAQDRRMTAYMTPWCGCCDGWVLHMRAAGWTVDDVEREDLAPIRARHGVPDRYAGCHTAVVGAYAIEGHVPASDVARLLRERPRAVALAAPDMPAGSPGMEAAGREPYVTLLIDRSGQATVFGRHNGA